MDDISGIQFRLRQRRSDQFLVHEDVHIRPTSARLVDDPIADSRKIRIERVEHRGDIRRLEDDFVLPVGVRAERRWDPHEHPRAGELPRRNVSGDDSFPRTSSAER